MKKCRLMLLPLFCLLLTGCGQTSPSGDDDKKEPTPAVVEDPTLNVTNKEMLIDEMFLLSVSNVPEGVSPIWSMTGDAAVSYTVYASKTSAQVKAIAEGQSVINIAIGETNLTCTIKVSAPLAVLATPTISLNEAKNGIVWNSIKGAKGYSVKVNDEAAVVQESTFYLFSQTEGQYNVQVIAKAETTEYDSVPANYSYETKIATVGELTFVNNNSITISTFVGMGLEAKFAQGEYADVTNGKISAPEDGDYTFHAKGGFDEDNNFYYVEGADATKVLNVVHSLKLSYPEIELNADRNGYVWDAVPGAIGYSIKVNNETAIETTDTFYNFAEVEGEYNVTLIALSEFEGLDSDPVNFSYEVIYTSLGELSINDGSIYWDSLVGLGVESKYGKGAYSPVSGDSVLITREATYTLHAIAGLNDDASIYYVENNESINQRQIDGVPVTCVLEDGSEENNSVLAETYYIDKYNTTWEPTSNPKIVLEDYMNEDYTDGNCVKLDYWANTVAYRYTKNITIDKSYDTLSLALYGDGLNESRVTIRLTIIEDLVVQGISLNGVYADYRINLPAASWNLYEISLSDTNWKINYGGTDFPVKDVEALIGMTFAEVLTHFGQISYIFRGNTTNGQKSAMYLDDVKFLNTKSKTSITPIFAETKLRAKYQLTTSTINAQLVLSGDKKSATATAYLGGNIISIPVTLVLDNDSLTITSTVQDKDFVLAMSTSNSGKTWSFVSCTGSFASYMQEAKLGELNVVEGFTSYTGTGQGYDKTHAADEASGLRAAFFCDYYNQWETEGVESPVGGPNWWLMGSNDYINYAADGCLDVGAARLKSSTSYKNMRYMSADLRTGAEPIAKGVNKMSVMMKGGEERDVDITIWAYYRNSLTASTQQSDRSGGTKFTVPQNSDWTQYTIDLDSSKVYYGFAFIVQAQNGEGAIAAYMYIDNIIMYK